MIRAEPYPQPLRLDTTPHPAPVTDSTWADARASLESWYRRETATTAPRRDREPIIRLAKVLA